MSVPRGWHEAWYLGGTQRTSVPSGNERMNQRFHSALTFSCLCPRAWFAGNVISTKKRKWGCSSSPEEPIEEKSEFPRISPFLHSFQNICQVPTV